MSLSHEQFAYHVGIPEGYYDQPMPRRSADADSPEGHLARLGRKLNGTAVLKEMYDGESHRIEVHHKNDGTSSMTWSGHNPDAMSRPGEISSVRSRQRGAASAIHDTARAMALDNPEIAFPKHSPLRTESGARWVYREQLRHGEQPWGTGGPPILKEAAA